MIKRSIFIDKICFHTNYVKKNLDLISFYVGIFLLPSAFSISIVFILFSIISSTIKNKKNIFNDKLNQFFLIACLLLIISTFGHYFWKDSFGVEINWEASMSLYGLANWIPLILIFIGSQPYLKTINLRKRFSIILLLGSLPVLFSCFSQYFLNWYGPYEELNGLIIWYQRPLFTFLGVTGLFNNQNYTASWLNIIWPFAIATFAKIKEVSLEKILSFFFLFATFCFLFLTGSRSGWIGMILAIPFVFGSKSIKWFFPSLIFCFSFIVAIVFPIFGKASQIFLQTYIPKFIWNNFSSKTYEGWDTSRLEIWKVAIKGIIQNAFIGNGASSFSPIFKYETGFWKGHAHNLPLELAFSYGLPVALLILGLILYIFYKAFKTLYFNRRVICDENIFENAWITSFLILILGHMVDIQYFDGRISIIGWLLLAGLRNMIKSG